VTPPLPPLPDEHEELIALARRRDRIAAGLTAAMMAAYFGFIALVAFAKPTAGTLLAGGRVSVGIVLGAAVIVLAPVLTSIYVRWANRHYDAAVKRLRRQAGGTPP
jgi:uncharacterized membrane protein (DUF485 family)